ncbi:ATP-binding protein [Flammeovirga aprica]|uniref:ATP-binding protein n=1 Tax=Flammeovirga aprica JL-4 TaxID=694437 RepID=A0A7X9P2Y6_9BACT|nr:ATP-binding protein [Flammeovirga aprica]NME67452.1 ATP-binding protein [Flammeovirga aprica JL-4]
MSWEHRPEIFKDFIDAFSETDFRVIVGGYLNTQTQFYIPSVRTFLKIFSKDIEDHHHLYLKLFTSQSILIKNGIIELTEIGENEDAGMMDKIIRVAPKYQTFLMGGDTPTLDHEVDFPARLHQSKLHFNDVVLSNETKKNIKPLERLLRVRPKLKELYEIKKRVSTNHIVVFSGSPGTGKTLTATTLGQKYNMDTYVLDLSRVLSRYVGDFEKAMEKVFDRLDGQNCILFIDEADSIFTKRNEQVNEAKDKYSNQEMSYLLQRLERFDGVVILASNVQDIRMHVDKAMMRRISYIIEFPFPLVGERLQLWEKSLPENFTFKDNCISEIANNFQLSGANVSSIVSELLIEAVDNEITEIPREMIESGIKKEFLKRDSRFMVCPDQSPGPLLVEQRLGRAAVHNGRRM